MTNEIEPSLIRVWGKDNENSPNFVEELGEFLGKRVCSTKTIIFIVLKDGFQKMIVMCLLLPLHVFQCLLLPNQV